MLSDEKIRKRYYLLAERQGDAGRLEPTPELTQKNESQDLAGVSFTNVRGEMYRMIKKTFRVTIQSRTY
jgi:hypothetical protein